MKTLVLFPDGQKQFSNWLFPHLKPSSFIVTLCCFILSFFFQFNTATAQVTLCSNCTANDVNIQSVELVQLNPAYAGDHSQPKYLSLPATCSGNTTVTGFLKITITQQATTRYGLSVDGDILKDGVYSSSFQYCDPAETSSGSFIVYVENAPIVWTCGTKLELKNLFVGWGNSSGSNACSATAPCDLKPHCAQFPLHNEPPIIIITPLSADFSATGSCSATQTTQSYSFDALNATNGTTGGTPPYPSNAYSWTIVNKSTSIQVSTLTGSNPSFNFSQAGAGPGVYTITLTVTDDNPTAVSTVSKDITVSSCCTTPVITNQTPAPICSGANVSLGANTFTGSNTIPSGSTYSWLAPATPGITGLGSGTDQTSFSTGNLTNNTSASIDVIYSVTPKSATCAGNNFTVTVTVTPNASIASVSGTTPVCVGATPTYTANSVVLGGGTAAWSSDNTAVATVNSSTGVVTAVSEGTANIIYTITGGCNGTVSAKQLITVTSNASIASVTGTTPVCVGATPTYTANSVVLGGGTAAWSSDNTAVATVNSSTGVVTAVSEGTANIVYTITGGCNGTASAKQSITVTSNASIGSVTGTTPVCVGATPTYTATSIVLGGGTGAWSSDNTAVATVNSSTGVVTAVSEGTANIVYTITGGCNATASAKQLITVTSNASIGSVTGSTPVCAGATPTYTANSVVLGGGTAAWSSDNTAVATVNSSTGVVTAVSGGTANIIYTITGGCNGTASAKQLITVTSNASIGSVTGTTPVCVGATSTYAANSVVLGGGTGAWSSDNTAVATVNTSTGVVTAVSGGTANIIYTITGGCNATASAKQLITVSPNASIASVTGTTPVCVGATPTYTANSVVLGGGTGAWSSDNTAVATVNSSTGVVTAVSGGTANIIYTITGGCNGTASAKQLITVTPNASIASVTGTTPVCVGATTTYTANSIVLGGGTGAWSSDNTGVATVNAGTGVVTALKPGTANIIFTITGGCRGTTSQKLITVSPNSLCAQFNGDYFANTASTTTGGSATVTLKYNISGAPGVCNNIGALVVGDFNITYIKDPSVNTVTVVPASATFTGGVFTIRYTIALSSSAYSGTVQFTLGLNNSNFIISPDCSDNPLVTVSTKVEGFVTGGGFIIPGNSGGAIGGTPVNGLRNNFGFNIKSGRKLQGNWNTIIRRLENGHDVVYQVKSNVAATLVVTKISNTSYRADMSFTSANFQNLTCPLCPVSANNGSVLVSVYDNGEPGGGIDKILITVKDHSGNVWYTSDKAANNSITYTNLQLLNQGNIQIHATGGALAYSANTGIYQREAPALSVSAYPNPSKDKITFSIESPVSGEASLEIYNITGQKLHTVYQGYLFAGRGQVINYNVPSTYKGSLIFILKVGDKQLDGKVLRIK